MSELQVVILNTFAYIILFLFCFIKYKIANLSTILSVFYAISAICSYLLYVFPLYSQTYTSQGVVTLPAISYLFTVNAFLILAFCRCDLKRCHILLNYNENLVLNIQRFLNFILTIYLIFVFPSSIYKFFSGQDLGLMRDELYGVNNLGYHFFISLILRLFGSTTILLLAFVCIKYFLLNRLGRVDKYSIVLYGFWKFNTVLYMISRSVIAFSFTELMLVFILFYHLIDKKVRKRVIQYGLAIAIIFYVFFSAISTARFGGDKMTENLQTLRYTGESQLNFAALEWPDLEKPFWGWSQFPLFRRILGLSYNDGLSREGETVFNSYIQDKFHYYNPTYIFHGLVGAWCFNWGFIITFILAFIFNYSLRRAYRNRRSLSFMLICVTIIFTGYIGKGIFYADYQSEPGNLLILYVIFLWFYLKKYGYNVRTKVVS